MVYNLMKILMRDRIWNWKCKTELDIVLKQNVKTEPRQHPC